MAEYKALACVDVKGCIEIVEARRAKKGDEGLISIGGLTQAQQRVSSLTCLLQQRHVSDMLMEILEQKASIYLEVLIFICMFYYIDVFLDIVTMTIFIQTGDPMFFMANLTGIALGILFSFVDMIRQVDVTRESRIVVLALGFLMPLQLHVILLSFLSIYQGQKHLLLYSAKLAESVVEATISALVQTYAVIFKSSIASENTVYWSIAISYCSIGFAFTTFDRSSMGLLGLPGGSSSWDFKLILVFFCRICEVTSRITSLALFQRATRNKLCLGTFGIIVGLILDGLVMFVLLVIYQGFKKNTWKNVFVAIVPSTFCTWNPLLEQEITHGIPACLYYTVRTVELVLSTVVSLYASYTSVPHLHRLNHKDLFIEVFKVLCSEFPDDTVPIIAFFTSTGALMVLVPVIRMCYADRLMLRYSGGTMAKVIFDDVAKNLRDPLLDFEGAQAAKNESAVLDVVEFHNVCDSILSGVIARLEQIEISTDTNEEPVWDSSLDSTPWDKYVRAPLARLLDSHLYKAKRNLQQHLSQRETVRRAVSCACNLGPYLKGVFVFSDCGPAYKKKRRPWMPCTLDQNSQARQNNLYMRYLRVVGDCLKEHSIQDDCFTLDRLPALLNTMPGWLRFELADKTASQLSFELRLFGEKLRIMSLVAQNGRRVNGRSFDPAIEDIFEVLQPKCRDDLRRVLKTFVPSVETSYLEGFIDMLLGEQMLVLVQIFKGIGPALGRKEAGICFPKSAGIAMVEGAVAMFNPGSERCTLDPGVQCEAMKQALTDSLIPQAVQDPELQAELDKLGFYGLTTDVRRVTHVANRPVKSPAEAISEIMNNINEDSSKGISLILTRTFALDAGVSETDKYTSRGHGALFGILATVGDDDLRAMRLDDSVCACFKTLRENVVKQCLDDLERMDSEHWVAAQRLDPLPEDACVIFKRLWQNEKNETLVKTEREKNMKDIHKFERESQKKWVAFLQTTRGRYRWSGELVHELEQALTKAELRWTEIRHGALEFWQEREEEVLNLLSAEHQRFSEASQQSEARFRVQQDEMTALATEYAEARAAQADAEHQRQLAEEKCMEREDANSKLQAANSNLQAENSNLQTENSNLQAENTNLRAELLRLKQNQTYDVEKQSAASNEPLLRTQPSQPEP